MEIDPDASLKEAVAKFYSHHGFPVDGGMSDKRWPPVGCRDLKAYLPNFEWRHRALPLHDIHHVLTGYGTAPMLAWMVEEKDIEPHVPVWDKTERKDNSLSSNDFHWNQEANEYRCPAGKPLRSEWRVFTQKRSRVTKANTIIYRSSQTDCATCSLKAKCCPNTPNRKIVRSIHEAARDVARRIAKTPEYLVSRCERKKVAMLFAHLKRIIKLDRLRLRGLTGATDEFTLVAMVQNLRRMAKLLPQGPPLTG